MHQLQCIMDCWITTFNKKFTWTLFEVNWTLHGILYESETVHKLDSSAVGPLLWLKHSKIGEPHDKSGTFPSHMAQMETCDCTSLMEKYLWRRLNLVCVHTAHNGLPFLKHPSVPETNWHGIHLPYLLFGHNWSRSYCFHVQPVTWWPLLVSLNNLRHIL